MKDGKILTMDSALQIIRKMIPLELSEEFKRVGIDAGFSYADTSGDIWVMDFHPYTVEKFFASLIEPFKETDAYKAGAKNDN